ncbi:glucose transporter [Aureococcus anophagefferens]|uniref:Hexose transporter 1 n=1 Tax=Aureococcus anophagefferens TaxID=44056 RepID=A0ABR1FLP0_AURAN
MKASKEETKEDGCLLDGNAPTKAMETAPSDASAALALVRRAALVANLSNLAFGYDVGVMSGALLYLRRPDQLGFTDVQAEVAASLFNLAAAAASLGVAGPLSDRRGRRAALLVSAALLLAGFVCQAFAPSFAVLAFGRALAGSGSGVAWVSASTSRRVWAIGWMQISASPLGTLMAELAPTKERGKLTAVADLGINVGIVVGYASSLACIGVFRDDERRWRSMLGLGASLPAALLLLRGALPESPRWLLANGRADEARRVLEAYHVPADAADTADAFANGSEGVLYYVGYVLRDGLGLASQVQVLAASLGVGVVKLLGVVVAMACVERAGRRPMLALSGASLAVTLALLAATVAAGAPSVVVVLLLCGYMFAFSLGAGSLAVVVATELQPEANRGTLVARAVFLNRLVSGTCAATFLSLTRRAGVDGTFAFYAVCSAMTAVVFARTPETKGLDLEAIHADAGADVELQSPLQRGAAV